ncbi:hypothetical protein GGC03_26745 (plasmid) [Vibrio sp. THAF191c]|nr:hypothetical protein FIU99_25910 [Vibrio sp. THAF64]QGM37668.1 hypothetical protein GGC04_25570 [Vibrio sp. THAF191d]QGN73389.1 hypothetical protein GGC03_26745 [Vibrio sp. THAF191c]
MYYLFDWKVKLGTALSCILFIACCISFIIAWRSPEPVDAMSAVTKYFHYRWFAVFLFGFVSMSSATYSVYQKRLHPL